MKRDFNATIKNLDGEPFKDGEPRYERDDKGNVKFNNDGPIVVEAAKDLTLKAACMLALGTARAEDANLDVEKKLEMYKLADRIVQGFKANGPVEVTSDEVTLLKKRIGMTWGIFVLGAAVTLLETDYVESAAASAGGAA
jgi:hypothetical protein